MLRGTLLPAKRVLAIAPLLLLPATLLGGAHAMAQTVKAHAMGSIPCSWSVPIQGKNHELDVEMTIRLLRANHFTCYVQPIEEQSPMKYDDFLRLLAAAGANRISIWPVLVPHTEGASLPYREDWMRWMKELAELSLQYPAMRGINIDDTDAGGNDKMFTRELMCRLYREKQEINPKLLFIPTIYDLDEPEADRLAGCVDGVWLWWANLEQNNGLRAFLNNGRLVAAGRFPVYAGIYAHSTSWHKYASPTAKVLKEALDLGCTHADGVVLWQLPLTPVGEENPMLEVAEEFVPGGKSPLAGRCGIRQDEQKP